MSKSLRWICPLGALCGVIVVAMDVQMKAPRGVMTLLSAVATLSCVSLLVAMFTRPRETGDRSRFLRSMIWVIRVGGPVWFAINLVEIVLNPTAGPVLTLLDQVCLFTAPFIIALTRGFR